MSPIFGDVPATPRGLAVLALAPVERGAGRFRVMPAGSAAGPRLAYGPAFAALSGLQPGSILSIDATTTPPLDGVTAAVGGDPLLLRDGLPIDDPGSVNYADRYRPIPTSAAAVLRDGTLLLVTVDGRRPATSVGVDRYEEIALLRGLRAADAMLFDGGGSTTLVGRVLGDAEPSILNDPSDGAERPVADGLFIYSDAPRGPAVRLVVRPSAVVALPGAQVLLDGRLIDAADHGLGEARGAWRADADARIVALRRDGTLLAGDRPGISELHVARGAVAGRLDLEIVEQAAHLVLGPPRVNPDPHATATLTLDAFDEQERRVATGGLVRWSAQGATIDAEGRLTTGDGDALVRATVGGLTLEHVVPVGRRVVPLDLFAPGRRRAWKFVGVPPEVTGALAFDGARLRLGYDFSAGGRAAYAVGDAPLDDALALTCAIDGDGNGLSLRAAVSDRDGRADTVTLAPSIDFSGTRSVAAAIPASLVPPLVLHAFSVVAPFAKPPAAAAGAVAIHDCSATVPGAGRGGSAAHASPAASAAIPSARAHAGGTLAIASAG
ncbi:MAG: phosphodiester glycosidase family protein [Candidatus Eremiobacteraeota bacterium]|nr:phosphodiester glycosidase family protein [Candidatus Eremiobacteraeota bacterium]